jgi:hypothetical protein
VNAWEWSAGSACGLSGDRRKASGHAEALLLSGEVASAVMQQVTVVTGLGALDGHYRPVSGTRVTGRLHGEHVRWHPEPGGAR